MEGDPNLRRSLDNGLVDTASSANRVAIQSKDIEAAGTDVPSAALTDRALETPGPKDVSHGLTDQTNFLPTRQVIMVFTGLSVALACSFLDQTIIATALPRIASDLHSGRESSWVATAYLLTSLAFTPLYGRWSDVFGRKVILMFSLVTFFVFSIACALSHTMIQLIVFRALQGIGGGAIIAMVLIIISDVVSLKDRGKYQGITEGVISLSNGVGPILGGLFAQYTTWRWVFWINLPMAGGAMVMSLFLVPAIAVKGDVKSKLLKIDYVGSALTIGASILLLLGLNWGGVTYPWSSAHVLTPLVLGVVVFGVFLVWEGRYAAIPIVPLRIFRNKTVTGVYIATAMNGMTSFSILYYVPQFLQLVRGNSAVTASLILLPYLAPTSLFVFIGGQITARTGQYRWLMIVGYSVWAIAQGLQSTITQYSSVAKIAGVLLMAGVSSGFTYQTSLIACQAAVSRGEMAVVTGVRNYVRLFGSTLALAMCATIVNNTLRTAVRPLHLTAAQVSALVDNPTAINDPSQWTLGAADKAVIVDGYTKGFRSVFYLTTACVLVALLATVTMIKQHDLDRADDQELKERNKELYKRRRMEKTRGRDAENGGVEAVVGVVAYEMKEGADREADIKQL